MTPDPKLDDLTQLVDLLIDCQEERDRERVLIEQLEARGWAQAAALHRRSRDHGWYEVVSRGPRELLPGSELVSALAQGELPAGLPVGRHVFLSRTGGEQTALALGGVHCDEEALELLEALFGVLVAVQGPLDAPAPSLLNLLLAPLPTELQLDLDPGEEEDEELTALLGNIQTVQAVLTRGLVGDAPSSAPADDHSSDPSAELRAWARGTCEHTELSIELELDEELADERFAQSPASMRRALWTLTEHALDLGSEWLGLRLLEHSPSQAALLIELQGAASRAQIDALEHALDCQGWTPFTRQHDATGALLAVRIPLL
jgi:hypothetical protein